MKKMKIWKIVKNWIRKGLSFGVLSDKVLFRDKLTITLRDNKGRVVKQWDEKHNTWGTVGLNNIRNAVINGGYTKINYMVCNGTGGSEKVTTNTGAVDKIAVFTAIWPSAGAITGITTFDLRQTTGGASQSQVIVTSFDKPDGISLEVTWSTTFS